MEHSLRQLMIEQIVSWYTIGREDSDLPRWTDAQIAEFITKHSRQLDDAVESMIEDYTDDGSLDDLEDPCGDWLREYMDELLS